MTRKIYYGWWIVLAAFGTLFVGAGIGFFTFPVFIRVIAEDMHWSRGSLSNAGAISALAAGFMTPVIGYAIDRYGSRTVMIPGAILLSVSFVLLSRITAVYQLYLLFLASGIGMAATTILPCQTLISRWFDKKRGRAMGIITVANAVGGVVWMNVAEFLITTRGWRNAYEILGVAIAAISLPLIWLIVRSSPAEMGLEVEGAPDISSESQTPESESPQAGREEAGYTMREALGTTSFWLIFCAIFFVMFASSGFTLHVIASLIDSGMSRPMATRVWTINLGISIAGRFLFGYLSERYQKRYMAAAANIFRSISLVVLIFSALSIAPQMFAVAQLVLLYGLGQGCNAVISPLMVSETFGIKAFGKIMGLIGIPYTIGMALGQITGGHLFDALESYNLAFGAYALAFLLAGIAVLFAKPCFLIESESAGRQGNS